MLEEFKSFIKAHNLFSPESKILLAVSGGIDSMVMLRLFKDAKFKIGVAHCNFQLRGKDSDEDQIFVCNTCHNLRIPYYSKKLKTQKFAEKHRISIQMAARQLRYDFFNKMKQKHGYHFIATAHNKNDQAETILINLLRGTGIAGMHGIRPKRDFLIRPLLFAARSVIKKFAKENQMHWREDASNKSEIYIRNKIRSRIIPVLEEINPSVLDTLQQQSEIMNDYEYLLNEHLQSIRKKIVSRKGELVQLDISDLKNHKCTNTLLFEMLKEYGFNRSTMLDISHCLNGESGKIFMSPTHRLVRDRRYLLISSLTPNSGNEYPVYEDQHQFSWEAGTLFLRKLTMTSDLKQKIREGKYENKNIAWFDADALEYPIRIRHWQKGDEFRPLGMKGKKKLSDFFTDLKYSVIRKEKAWLLVSGGRIAWVIGERMDDRFRITQKTNTCIEIIFEK